MASGLEDYEKIAVLGELPSLSRVCVFRVLILAAAGAGALAQVHLAKRNQDGRYFALKVMDKKRIIKMKQLEHIHNEKSLLEEVDHPFIIKL